MLHPEFLQRLRSLPQAYVYGEYRQIYRDYGTHYITEATLGGQYEHTIILNKEKLETTGKKNKKKTASVLFPRVDGTFAPGVIVTEANILR